MKKMSKKVSLLLLTISCGCFGTSLLNAALTEDVNAKVESTESWQIDSSEDNRATFEGQGAIEVINNTGSATGANVTFVDGTADDAKKNALLTLDFQNEPLVDIRDYEGNPITEGAGGYNVSMLVDLTDENGEPIFAKAHIFAKAVREGDNSVRVSSTAVDMTKGGKLEVTAADGKQPVLAAYSYKNNNNYNGNFDSAVIRTSTGGGNNITVSKPSKLLAFVSHPSGYGTSSSAAAVIGVAESSESDITTEGSNRYNIGNGNNFVSYSAGSNSGAVVIGVATGYGDANVGSGNIYSTGSDNKLIAAARANSYFSASAVIGAACGGYGAASIGDDNSYIISDYNTFISSSGDSRGAASVIIGAASHENAVVGNGNCYEIGTENGGGNKFIASSYVGGSGNAAAAVIGAASSENGVTIGERNIYSVRGDDNRFDAYSCAYNHSVAVVFGGAGTRGNVAIGKFNKYNVMGNNSTFTSFSMSKSSSSYSVAAAVFGTVKIWSGIAIEGKSVYNIVGSGNTFDAFTTGGNYLASVVIGAAFGYGYSGSAVKIGGGNTYKIGSHNTLTASEANAFLGNGFLPSDRIYFGSAVIGAVTGQLVGSNLNVEGSNVYEIGSGNILAASSFSYSSSSYKNLSSGSVIIGAAVGDIGDDNSTLSVTGDHEITVGARNMFSSIDTIRKTKKPGYAAAGIFGAICGGKVDSSGNLLQGPASTARGMSINLNGSQTISALAGAFGKNLKDGGNQYNDADYEGFCHGIETVNVFGADDTDKREDVLGDGGDVTTPGDKYGWRVGIYNEEETPAVVNILGAKLGEDVVFMDEETDPDNPSKKTLTPRKDVDVNVVLSADQGSSYQDYARAFALGKDLQIYIGGKSRIKTDPETKEVYVPGEGESQFEVVGNGIGNVVNIFGAIAPAQYAANTISTNENNETVNQLAIIDNTKLVVDNNWTANTFAPVEGLEKFTIKNGAVVNAFDRIQKIGSLRLKGGTLNLKTGGRECLEAALMSMTNGQGAPRLIVTRTIGNADTHKKEGGNYAVGSIGLADDYESNENRFAKGGKLTLGAGEVLRFYIDTSSVTEDGLGEVSGMIKVDSGLEDALDFQPGSRIEIVDDRGEPLPEDPAKIETIPAKFVLLQADGMRVQDFLGQDDFANLEEKTAETWALKSSAVNAALAGLDSEDSEETNEAAQSRGLLKGFVRALYANAGDEPMLLAEDDEPVSLEFDQYGGNARMYLNGTVKRALQSEPSLPGIGSSSAQINTAVVSMFRNAINPRLAGISSRGDGAFIYGIGGHVHRSSIAGIGYGGDLYGVAAGADKLLNYKDGCVRLGAMIGYIYGDVDFHGSAIGKKQKSKQDNYLCALYCAYGSINEKNLKTDLNLSCGFGYTKHRLNRVDQQGAGYNAKMKSNNFFLSVEFIKNLYAVQGIQFGLWLRADYNHIHQKAYSENGGAGAQSISKAKFDFLDTTIGVNIEKEIQNSTNLDRSLRLYMKAGWNCQPMRSHSTIVAGVNGKDSVVSPHFGSHNSAVFVAGLRQKLNARWDLIGEWNGSFNKKHSNNLITFGAGYTF